MSGSYPRFTVAAVQAASVFFDRDKTIDKAVRYIEEAADHGAVIIGFPESFIPGEPNVWYAAKESNPFRAHGRMFKEYVKNAVEVPSPATDRLCAAAKKAHAFVVVGMGEQDTRYPGTLYVSQLIISDSGEILGVHRKLVSTSEEKLVFTQGDASYLNVFETPYGRLSALNCGEHAHSLFKYAVLAMGSQIHVASWSSFPDQIYSQSTRNSVDFRVRQFAHEGKIFVINSCGVADKQNIDYCCNTAQEKEQIVENSGGGSSIIGPSGDYLAGPMRDGEGVVTAEISLDDAFPGKQLHNVLGHYSRWDIFSLNCNRERFAPFGPIVPTKGQSDGAEDVRHIKQEVERLSARIDKLENGT